MLVILTCIFDSGLSESFFLIHINILDPPGNSVLLDSANAISHSLLEIIIVLIILVVLNFITSY
jgi:hypothetical protein